MKLASVINSTANLKLIFGEYENDIDRIIKMKEGDPDVAIECCKSLIEGISKKIIITLDESETTKTVDKKDFPEVFYKAINLIPTFDPEFGIDFNRRAGALITIVTNVRNKRGKISHGKAYPLESSSVEPFADLVTAITDGLLVYMLVTFNTIEKEVYQNVIQYEDNEEFNAYLDEEYLLPGIRYSRALYDQDYDAYIEMHKNYTSGLEGNL